MSALYRKKRPVVLVIAGHDPSGGAGLQADIETISALGAHALTVMSADTVQNSQDVSAVRGHDPQWIARQLKALQRDCSIDAVKIGMLGDSAILDVIVDFLNEVCPPHVVLDPVLRSSSGHELADDLLIRGIREQLLPLVEVTSPNHDEARCLVGADYLEWEAWSGLGVRQVLITGGDEATDKVETLWLSSQTQQVFYSERQPGAFHGTGCTFSSALAVWLARGETLEQAIPNALGFVHQALSRAHYPGQGMAFPWRITTHD